MSARAVYLVIWVLSLGLAVPATAQQRLEEIVVTARKKQENLQEIPLVIRTFSAEVLERKGIDSLDDIARLTPGMQFDQIFAPQDTRVVIRGLSPTRGRPNVAFLQDGIDISSEAVASAGGSLLINPRLFDLERVEVVKGPQSALYGRTAFAGAINYVTQRPGDERRGKLGVDVGSDGQMEVIAGISGPVIEDRLRLGITGAVWEHDGFYSNSVTGADIGDQEGFGLSLAAVYTPSDTVNVFARMEYTDDEFGIFPWAQSPGNTQLSIPVSALGSVISPAVTSVPGYRGEPRDADEQTITISPDPRTGSDYPGTTRDIFRLSVIVDWELGLGTLTSLTHFVDSTNRQVSENARQGDVNTLGFATLIDYENDVEIFSQELRLSSNDDDGVRWLVGVNYWQEEAHQDELGFACVSLPFAPCGPFMAALPPYSPRMWDRDEESLSIFGSLSFDFNDQWSLALEARQFWEDQFVSGPAAARVLDPLGLLAPFPVTSFGPIGQIEADDSDSYFTPRATLEYTPTDDALIYFSVAEGGKPAGLSTVGAASGGFDPELFAFDSESVWVYELGAKTSWLDGRLLANAALYYQDFSGKQASSQVVRGNGLLGTKTVNASDAEVTGLEVDLSWAVTDMLSVSLGYSYIDATYEDFKTTTGGAAPISQVGNCTPVVLGGQTLCEVDRSGNELEDSAEHSWVLGATLGGAVNPRLDWFVEADVQYTGDRFDTADNIVVLPSHTLVDLRLGLRGESWDVTAYAENLFEDDTIKTAFLFTDFSTLAVVPFPPPFTFVLANGLMSRMPDPRQVGIRASYRF